jgi:hypothetical protein
MLEMSAPSHGGITVSNGKALQGGNDSRQFLIDNLKPSLDLQDTGRVHNVLRRGAPVDVLSRRTTHGAELAHQGQDWVSDNIGLVTKTIEVESRNISLRCNLVTSVGGNDTAMSLRPREGRLDINTSSDVCLVAKDLAKRQQMEITRRKLVLTLRISCVPNKLRKMTESKALMEPRRRHWG